MTIHVPTHVCTHAYNVHDNFSLLYKSENISMLENNFSYK